jgi:hypothetical protein
LHASTPIPCVHSYVECLGLEWWFIVATPLLEACEDDTLTPEMGTWESFGTPKTLEFNYKGKNTSPWGVLHVIGKLLKYRCRKWSCMSHLDNCSTIYGKNKGQESNWRFDSRPLKVGNQPDSGVCRWSATHRWKALNESYEFASNLIPIRGLSKKLWTHKIPKSKSGQFRDSSLGVPGLKAIQMWVPRSNAENTIWGKVVASPESGPWWILWVQSCSWLVLAPKYELTNLLVGLM